MPDFFLLMSLFASQNLLYIVKTGDFTLCRGKIRQLTTLMETQNVLQRLFIKPCVCG